VDTLLDKGASNADAIRRPGEIFSLYLPLGGCFVCTRGLLKIGTQVRVTLTRKDQNLMALAVARAAKPRTGMGLEFLDVNADWNKTPCPGSGGLRQLG